MRTNRKNVMLGIVAGVGLTALAGILMGQGTGGASQPVKSETQYFVTGEGDEAQCLSPEIADGSTEGS